MCRFSEDLKRQIWNKAKTVEGKDPSSYRKDACGAWIKWDDYNQRNSDFGWEIDHVYPESLLKKKGADNDEIDNIINLRPFNWRNNVSKDQDFPVYQSSVIAEGNRNIEKKGTFVVNGALQEEINNTYSKYL